MIGSGAGLPSKGSMVVHLAVKIINAFCSLKSGVLFRALYLNVFRSIVSEAAKPESIPASIEEITRGLVK